MRNVKAWKARPPRRMLLGVVVSLRFEDATPINAAPRIWTMVATTSQVMKM
jgi:hypothetical protein